MGGNVRKSSESAEMCDTYTHHTHTHYYTSISILLTPHLVSPSVTQVSHKCHRPHNHYNRL